MREKSDVRVDSPVKDVKSPKRTGIAHTSIAGASSRSNNSMYTRLKCEIMFASDNDFVFRYLEGLITEIKALRARDANSRSHSGPQATQPDPLDIRGPAPSLPISGAFIEPTPWYMDSNIPNTPILIGEPSEPGFATRVVQAISKTMHSHIPRSNYPTEEQILLLSDAECPWPVMSKARLLISAALKAVNQHYYVVQRSCIWAVLDRAMDSPDTLDSFLKSKLWALFAIGELYSVRRIPTGKVYPGLAYFAKATRSLRVICERPRLDGIETRLLLVSLLVSLADLLTSC